VAIRFLLLDVVPASAPQAPGLLIYSYPLLLLHCYCGYVSCVWFCVSRLSLTIEKILVRCTDTVTNDSCRWT
jgi:hypothetical protein